MSAFGGQVDNAAPVGTRGYACDMVASCQNNLEYLREQLVRLVLRETALQEALATHSRADAASTAPPETKDLPLQPASILDLNVELATVRRDRAELEPAVRTLARSVAEAEFRLFALRRRELEAEAEARRIDLVDAIDALSRRLEEHRERLARRDTELAAPPTPAPDPGAGWLARLRRWSADLARAINAEPSPRKLAQQFVETVDRAIDRCEDACSACADARNFLSRGSGSLVGKLEEVERRLAVDCDVETRPGDAVNPEELARIASRRERLTQARARLGTHLKSLEATTRTLDSTLSAARLVLAEVNIQRRISLAIVETDDLDMEITLVEDQVSGLERRLTEKADTQESAGLLRIVAQPHPDDLTCLDVLSVDMQGLKDRLKLAEKDLLLLYSSVEAATRSREASAIEQPDKDSDRPVSPPGPMPPGSPPSA